ncbi:hypothetical protein BJ165DRAFT_688021 [Panaeolus papilionaceus]|nr:hypothetical protein BJ165DRAFT_688021 [Panaeolus papilionaceus]
MMLLCDSPPRPPVLSHAQCDLGRILCSSYNHTVRCLRRLQISWAVLALSIGEDNTSSRVSMKFIILVAELKSTLLRPIRIYQWHRRGLSMFLGTGARANDSIIPMTYGLSLSNMSLECRRTLRRVYYCMLVPTSSSTTNERINSTIEQQVIIPRRHLVAIFEPSRPCEIAEAGSLCCERLGDRYQSASSLLFDVVPFVLSLSPPSSTSCENAHSLVEPPVVFELLL